MTDAVQVPDDFAMEAGSAANSRDSALQYVAGDILESGGDTDAQEALLDPVEEELREHWDTVAHEGVRAAFSHSPWKGAEKVVEDLKERLEYEEVPDEHLDEVRTAVEKRLDQKRDQLERTFDLIVSNAKRQAVSEAEEDVIDWVTVV